ncbi:hypothetical protein [Mycobacterium lepromatosis]|uniref:hypothetical protein n=1 Tax=Mycobacterium lepromatosis TaxID=480418 RepID=UPI000ABE643A|nr:hypothetical protein [Mycobacterium lepromatosis]
MDAEGEVPVDVNLNGADGAIDANSLMVDATTMYQVCSVLKVLSISDIRFSYGAHGRHCGHQWCVAVVQLRCAGRIF